MIEVTFHTLVKGQDTYVGVIRWDGSAFTIDPPDRGTLRAVLAMPMRDTTTGFCVRAEIDPERWMEGLCSQYKTSYLRASEAKRS